ncbi:MAG: GTPase ObgE [Bacilli bacterium]|jgi:GTP-binding protein
MFIDRVKIEVHSGKGGDGMIAFLTQKYIARGGPSGGNGGRGGSIVFVASKEVTTLVAFRYSKKIEAEDGAKGMSNNKYGRSAKDVYVKLPVGTVIYEEPEHRLIADLSTEGQEFIVAKGGRGGRGNACFKSSVNRAPRIAENGVPGELKTLTLELKLLADVGLVGLPSVGKSTLLSVVSNAKPEIADYEFTTIYPNLGVVELPSAPSFVVADLPGLIEGAHLGKGLGLEFLRHLERCRVIVHVINMASGRDPVADYRVIKQELKTYQGGLAKRPAVIAASKMDEPGADEALKLLKRGVRKVKIFPISALTHEGINELMYECARLIKETPEMPLYVPSSEVKRYSYKGKAAPFDIVKKNEHTFVITGERVTRTYRLINISTDEGLLKLLAYLRKLRVEDRLKEMGAQDGDTVILEDFEFDYYA